MISTETSTREINTHWQAFSELVRGRLDKGRAEYGDQSFDRPLIEIAGEVEQELLDVCGWSFVQYCRLQAAKRKLVAIEQAASAE